jgi:hypothetical protein
LPFSLRFLAAIPNALPQRGTRAAKNWPCFLLQNVKEHGAGLFRHAFSEGKGASTT